MADRLQQMKGGIAMTDKRCCNGGQVAMNDSGGVAMMDKRCCNGRQVAMNEGRTMQDTRTLLQYGCMHCCNKRCNITSP